ncbi:hypothetical protein [Streptomyces sp. HD]|uniref:hypothetical protein n=1 Tax=Streptomyces sp. HD TaxID=3020892 RepID=UPI0023305DEB|nr:hypothetical protein [Streptomyces sp. HD]MDC0769368.1 hypothetical protein [Streptomyces sp. HD]
MNTIEPQDPAHSISEIELPADPADLFVALYDELPDEHFSGRQALTWYNDPDLQNLADSVCDDVTQHGRATLSLVRGIIHEYGDMGRFTVLIGLDQAFRHAGVHPGYIPDTKLEWLSRRYNETHSLNSNTKHTGLLLPRFTRPGRLLAEPADKPDFFGVHRVTPSQCAGIRHTGIEPDIDPGFHPEKPISIGSAPIAETHHDLKFDYSEANGAGLYRITPKEGVLGPRIETVIHDLENSGAVIGVLPECTLSNDLLEHWEGLLDADPPPASSLEWILLGTGPLGCMDPPPNRAVLVDRITGKHLLKQDKRAGFTFGVGQAAEWGLPGRPVREPVAEDITRGQQVTVLETTMGRIAVLICEDVKQNAAWIGKCQAFGVSHIFVPLFAAPISWELKKWERIAAEHCVDELGAWVVLANSLAVGHALDLGPRIKQEDFFNCLVIGPRIPRPKGYVKHPAQFCRSDSGTELARVICDENGDKPAVEVGTPPPLPSIQCGRGD